MTEAQIQARTQEILKIFNEWQERRVADGELKLANTRENAVEMLKYVDAHCNGKVSFLAFDEAYAVLMHQNKITLEVPAHVMNQLDLMLEKTNQIVQHDQQTQAALDQQRAAEDAARQEQEQAAKLLERRNARDARQLAATPGAASAFGTIEDREARQNELTLKRQQEAQAAAKAERHRVCLDELRKIEMHIEVTNGRLNYARTAEKRKFLKEKLNELTKGEFRDIIFR